MTLPLRPLNVSVHLRDAPVAPSTTVAVNVPFAVAGAPFGFGTSALFVSVALYVYVSAVAAATAKPVSVSADPDDDHRYELAHHASLRLLEWIHLYFGARPSVGLHRVTRPVTVGTLAP